MGKAGTLVALVALAGCGRIGFDPDGLGSSGDGADPLVDAALDARSPIVARFEAESAQITALFQLALDPQAIGGMYLLDGNVMGVGGSGEAIYSFTVPEAGTYWMWGRARATSQATDSMFLQIDGGADHTYFTSDCSYSDQWRWVIVTIPYICPGPGTREQFVLSAGPHTLRLRSREGGTAIDAIAIVDDPMFVPTD